ncbi:PilZ domain-containing protein [Octadecabacter sp. G9-8]|uniref:PilZ domain-containing protein n=1 Tax=Octadecabacter dasysiphoniae TaxID=2909341 RepID=A0ABS9CUL5_9RHOB|nr:PilZ domain-containing protein [Octadecabacter dasysiphoniae]MCF2870626.1 PilZ domain-containing protein [Octadecabacter dasysiphoniae]
MGYRPHRYPTMFPVDVVHGTTNQKCHLTNITPTGAGVFEVKGVNKGDVITVKSSVGNLVATVQWAEDDQCGVKFAQQLGTRQIAQIRQTPKTFGAIHRPVHAFTELR